MIPTSEDWRKNPEHRELQAMIDAGWGSVPQHKIPADWRTRTPPTYYQDVADIQEVDEASKMRKRQLEKRTAEMRERGRQAARFRWSKRKEAKY